jgi:hypothetical protein
VSDRRERTCDLQFANSCAENTARVIGEKPMRRKTFISTCALLKKIVVEFK